MKVIPIAKAETLIPPGPYCYMGDPSRAIEEGVIPIICCPFWRTKEDAPAQSNGWCDYLNTGDMVSGGTFLLWDQVKECDVKYSHFLDQAEYDEAVQAWLAANKGVSA